LELVDKMPDGEFPKWLDKTEVSTVGVLTQDDGKEMTVEIAEFDEERSELIVNVISPTHHHLNGGPGRYAISIDRIVDFEPQPRTVQPWPFSDPCRNSPFSLERFVLMSTIFLSSILSGLFFFLLMKQPYGLQESSAVSYTFSVAFLTFAATRNFRRYLFTCPAVQPELPRLFLRHLGFLVVLFLLQSAALAVRPSLSEWWNFPDSKGSTPFELALMLLCFGLGFAQVYANRSILERAHRKFSA
jgi:hypothetical protein